MHKPSDSSNFKVFWAFLDLKVGQSIHLHDTFLVNGQYCYLSTAKIKNRNGKPEQQIFLSFNRPEEAVEIYKSHWQIETYFNSLKSREANVKDSHLADIQ